jgi:signal transduction histidine kinase
LRHSTAATCVIEATAGDGLARPRITNDGAGGQATGRGRAGSGLANLTARVEAADDRLTSRQADGRFDLVAVIPLAPPPGTGLALSRWWWARPRRAYRWPAGSR